MWSNCQSLDVVYNIDGGGLNTRRRVHGMKEQILPCLFTFSSSSLCQPCHNLVDGVLLEELEPPLLQTHMPLTTNHLRNTSRLLHLKKTNQGGQV
jgi:hypothetical protein